MKKLNQLLMVFFVIVSLLTGLTDNVFAMKRKEPAPLTSGASVDPEFHVEQGRTKGHKITTPEVSAKPKEGDESPKPQSSVVGSFWSYLKGVGSLLLKPDGVSGSSHGSVAGDTDGASKKDGKGSTGKGMTKGKEAKEPSDSDSSDDEEDKGDVGRDPRLGICLQQGRGQGLHCGFFALVNALKRVGALQDRVTAEWLRRQLGSPTTGGYEKIVYDGRLDRARRGIGDLSGPEFLALAHPTNINRLMEEDLELILCHLLKNAGFSDDFKRATGTTLDEKQAMELAQLSRNCFDDRDRMVSVLETVGSEFRVPVYRYFKNHPINRIIIVNSISHAEQIRMGKGSLLVSACVERHRTQKLPIAAIINPGYGNDFRAVFHWIAWSLDEKDAQRIDDSLYSFSTLSARHEGTCAYLGRLFTEETSARLDAKGRLLEMLEGAVNKYRQSDEKRPEYHDALVSFLTDLVNDILKKKAVREATKAEIQAVREGKQPELSWLSHAYQMIQERNITGDLVEIIKILSKAFPRSYARVKASGRMYKRKDHRNRAVELFNQAQAFCETSILLESDFQELITFLHCNDLASIASGRVSTKDKCVIC